MSFKNDLYAIRVMNSLKAIYNNSIENNIEEIKSNDLSIHELLIICIDEINKSYTLCDNIYNNKDEIKIILQSHLIKTLKILNLIQNIDNKI